MRVLSPIGYERTGSSSFPPSSGFRAIGRDRTSGDPGEGRPLLQIRFADLGQLQRRHLSDLRHFGGADGTSCPCTPARSSSRWLSIWTVERH